MERQEALFRALHIAAKRAGGKLVISKEELATTNAACAVHLDPSTGDLVIIAFGSTEEAEAFVQANTASNTASDDAAGSAEASQDNGSDASVGVSPADSNPE